ncbi:unnamed protein product [Danaus chrysippus]|uniref:DNA polymerase alpha subunit B n=1 Tax=Danaus chrysippus TaxID=151541 RepID=A0A8J2QQL8_9NEOP|nr:unnamed protein product [Danaus chrysippus]
MATEELVTEQFKFLGIEVSKEVLSKCVSICTEYDVDAETFIEQWMAFSLTTLNGASPTLDNLELLEKREFSKRSASRLTAVANEVTHSSTGTSLTVYGAPVAKQENSVKYTSRTNQGTVVHSYGEDKLLDMITNTTVLDNLLELNIVQIPNDDGELYNKAKYGFELLHEKASIFDNHIRYISQCIMKKNGLSETVSVRYKTQTEVFVAGRIECDADARLNSKSVILQGTWEDSLSQTVPLDLDSVQQYSLFPGQVVVVRGINPRGNKFVAQELFSDAARAVPDPASDITNTLKGTLSMVVAAGPYTTSNNMSYEPLKDFIAYLNTHKPHVVIMTGPFVDCDHEKVKDNSMAETYKSFFDKLIDSIADIANTSPFTKIYIVSNHKDAFHVNIYPTPPYSSRKKHPNIQFLPDPSTLNINGYIVGITSYDVLMSINQEEISHGLVGDKLSRLSGHVLRQQCYYPTAGSIGSLAVDGALWAAHAQLPATPHILVVPSNFRYFVKEVNGCVVINPEHLSKGAGGGTFARLVVRPPTEEKTNSNIAAQIVRI